MKSLFQLIRRPLTCVAGLSFAVNLLLLAPALFMLQVFDRVLVSQSVDTLLVLLIGMGLALTLLLALDYLRGRLQGITGNMVAESLSPTVAMVMLAKIAQGKDRASTESLRDVAALRNLFSAQGLIALFDIPWVVVYVAVIWLAHPVLGIAAALSAVLMLGLAVLNDRLTRRNIEALQMKAATASRYLEASLQNAEVVQSLGMRAALIGRWQILSASISELQRPTARNSVALAALTRTMRQGVQVALQALGAYLVITGEGTPGVMVATTLLLGRALAPVEQVVGNWRVLAEGRLAFNRLARLLASVDSEPRGMALPVPTGHLAAHGVVYRAPGSEHPIIAGVSLTLEPGQALAVIGPSGAGKSTLARLLTGILPPTAGVVRLDHVDLSQWSRDELGPWLGYVPQDVELFSATVAENIARLNDIDSDKVVRAAQRAGVHELILKLPNGYDTQVEPTGGRLSPGQRQRIALARALYGEPRLLILDEPNSNLDGAGELALAEALKALHGEVTVVVVTHRTSLIQHVDKMLVLEAGRVKEYGSVEDVLKALRQPPSTSVAEVATVPRSRASA